MKQARPLEKGLGLLWLTRSRATGPRTMLHAAELILPRVGKSAIEAHAPLAADFVQFGFSDG